MSSSRHHQDQRHSWASLTETQRRGYSSAVDQHLSSVQVEVDRVRAAIEVAQGIIERQQEFERKFNDVTAPDSPLCAALAQWSHEWRAEERSFEPPIDQAHDEHNRETREVEQRAKEIHKRNSQLVALRTRLDDLIAESGKAERDTRNMVRAHHERDADFKAMVDRIGALSTELSRVEVDEG